MEITGEIKISSSFFAKLQKEVKNVPDFKEKIKKSLSKKTTELLEAILGGAISINASDLHFEPEKELVKIRTRIDGVLQKVIKIEKKTYETLLARIKLLSGIKLNINDRPQDGRFSILIEKKATETKASLLQSLKIEVRTSVLPSEHGETVVLRILNPKSLIEIDALGLKKDLFEIFKKEIKNPNGMIIVTGPTGSGKTTTLYAFLKSIQKPEIKIITIEDPIEYHLEGISQTQTKPEKGYTFASGLKSLMRQDPDVILVGEVRDLETAQTALQAALTGHLVFTTLHANDAAGTVARLTSLGAKPSNIGPAINLAIAQRLVRKICKKCGQLKKVSPQELKKIKRALRGIPKRALVPKIGPGLKIIQVKGCKYCNFTGYRGRIGIFEAFMMNDEMEKFILTSPSIAALKDRAIKQGMVTMRQDGIIKALEGVTTIEEVERIAGEDE